VGSSSCRVGKIELRTETHPLSAVNDVLAKLRAGEVRAAPC
jgi:hypothetical protein